MQVWDSLTQFLGCLTGNKLLQYVLSGCRVFYRSLNLLRGVNCFIDF